MKRRALAKLRNHPNLAPVGFDDFFANGEPDSGSRVFLTGMQALKNLKNFRGVVGIDPNTGIAHCKFILAVVLIRSDLDVWRFVSSEFQCVFN